MNQQQFALQSGVSEKEFNKNKTAFPLFSHYHPLIEQMSECFSVSDLQDLLFNFGFDTDNFESSTNFILSANIVKCFYCAKRVKDLISKLKECRPHIDWENYGY